MTAAVIYVLIVDTVIAYGITGAVLWVIRRTVFGRESGRLLSFKWMDFWLGSTERLTTTALVIWSPKNLPAFIGAWVALKFASNWKRQNLSDPRVFNSSLIFLIGSVISIDAAIVVGLRINHSALQALNQ
jgi:hypothetical protein